MTDKITAETDAMFDELVRTKAIHGSVADEERESWTRMFANATITRVPAAEFDALQALLADNTPRPTPNLDKLARRPRVFAS